MKPPGYNPRTRNVISWFPKFGFKFNLYHFVVPHTLLCRYCEVSQGPKRESRATMLWDVEGRGGWVETRELGVTYGLDVTKVGLYCTSLNAVGCTGLNAVGCTGLKAVGCAGLKAPGFSP